MAHKVAAASGNYGTAATWNSVTNTPTLHASTVISISTTNLFTAAFTAPNTTNACTGVLIHITNIGGGAGTLTVTLQESTVDTAATVSIAGRGSGPEPARGDVKGQGNEKHTESDRHFFVTTL